MGEQLLRVEPDTAKVVAVALASGPDGLWLGTPAGLFRVDPDALD